MKTHRVYIEVKKSESEVICLEPKTEDKILEASAILDVVNTELNLGLTLNLKIEPPKDKSQARRLVNKWNRLLNGEQPHVLREV